jgi:hypothetical protein
MQIIVSDPLYANLNTYLHALVLDGVYGTAGAEQKEYTPAFIQVHAPTA